MMACERLLKAAYFTVDKVVVRSTEKKLHRHSRRTQNNTAEKKSFHFYSHSHELYGFSFCFYILFRFGYVRCECVSLGFVIQPEWVKRAKHFGLKLIGKICVKTSFIWVGNIMKQQKKKNEIVALCSMKRNPVRVKMKKNRFYHFGFVRRTINHDWMSFAIFFPLSFSASGTVHFFSSSSESSQFTLAILRGRSSHSTPALMLVSIVFFCHPPLSQLEDF